MGLKTALYDTHILQGAKIVDFGGWEMPLHYGSQIEEHHAVRRDAGMFDVSHMGVIDLEGDRVRDFLRRLLANDVGRLTTPGKALYSCMLLPGGGVIDDLIVYFISDTRFRVVVNAGTRDKDLAWISRHAADFAVTVALQRDLAMIAIQGPNARDKTLPLLAPALRGSAGALAPFCGAAFDSWFVARTGYTGEDGFEVMLPAGEAAKTWNALRAQGVQPAGLGARDTLRLEAGMNLYGNDMDEQHHPLESGLAWTVAFEPRGRDFLGRPALEGLRGAAGDRARRADSRRTRRAAQSSESRGGLDRAHRRRRRRSRGAAHRRSHQRHVFSDHESFHRAGAGAGRGGLERASRDSRQDACGTHRQAAVRASWEGVDFGLA